jgi:hypothetical protein
MMGLAAAGFYNAAVLVGLSDNQVALVPNRERTCHVAAYNTVRNAAQFIGALDAGTLASTPARLVAGLRIAGVMFGARQFRKRGIQPRS